MPTPLSTERPAILRLRDPLSDVTRRERRALLGASLLGIAIAQTGLLPTEISALGVKLAGSEQKTFLILFSAVCGYFLVAFITYAVSDFIAWQLSLQEAIRQRMRAAREREDDDYDRHIHREVEDMLAEQYPGMTKATGLVLPVSWTRAFVEFIVPVLFSSYAIYALLRASVA